MKQLTILVGENERRRRQQKKRRGEPKFYEAHSSRENFHHLFFSKCLLIVAEARAPTNDTVY